MITKYFFRQLKQATLLRVFKKKGEHKKGKLGLKKA